MTKHERRSRNRCFSRTLRHEWLESRSLMAGDILDTPVDPNLDISSGFAEVRGALEYKADNVNNRPDVVDAIGPDATVLDISSGYAWTCGLIAGESDQDVFIFEMPKAGPIQIAGTTYRGDHAGFQISLFDSEGVQVGQSGHKLGYGGANTLIEVPELAAGKYNVVVHDANGETVGYSFFVIRTWTEGRDDKGSDENGSDENGSDENGSDENGSDENGSDENGSDGTGTDEDFAIRIIVCDGVYYYGDGMEPRSDESLSNNGLSDGEPGEESVQGGVPLRMHNEAMPADVDGDSRLTPLDALVLINLLNTRGSGQVSSFAPSQESPDRSSAGKMFIDTNNDSFLSPLDVLMVINQLNVQMPENARGTSVGEGEADRKDAVFATAIDWTFFSGEDEEDESGLFGDVHLLSRI